jgi:hypothetical protein
MAIKPEDLDIEDSELARRVIVHARAIAPCLDSLADDPKRDAIAILSGVAREALARGVRSVASQGVGTARVTYGAASSWFTQDDRDALRSLCPSTAQSADHPVGLFPGWPRAYRELWPEED